MKFLKVTLKQAFIAIVFLAVIAIGIFETDPSDDFSLSLHLFHGDFFTVMPEATVVEILTDRIDLLPKSQIPKLAHHLLQLCREYRFDPAFILSLIEVESGFRIRAVSPAGAIGLMQMMPSTAQVLGETVKKASQKDRKYIEFSQVSRASWKESQRSQVEVLLKNPFINLELGMAYLAWLRDRYQGRSPYYLVAAYNVGPTKMDELLSRKRFKPDNTKRYYEAIRRNLTQMRNYRRPMVRERDV